MDAVLRRVAREGVAVCTPGRSAGRHVQTGRPSSSSITMRPVVPQAMNPCMNPSCRARRVDNAEVDPYIAHGMGGDRQEKPFDCERLLTFLGAT